MAVITGNIYKNLSRFVSPTVCYPDQSFWLTLVIIPKPGSTDYRSIGLVDPLWKIIHTRITESIHFHKGVNGFLSKHGT